MKLKVKGVEDDRYYRLVCIDRYRPATRIRSWATDRWFPTDTAVPTTLNRIRSSSAPRRFVLARPPTRPDLSVNCQPLYIKSATCWKSVRLDFTIDLFLFLVLNSFFAFIATYPFIISYILLLMLFVSLAELNVK